MDPFEVRMQFLSLLRRLSASQQSIQKLVGFSVKYFAQCGEDLWECIVEECSKGTINSRINILYFLDSLCEACLLIKPHSHSIPKEGSSKNNLYVGFINRDLGKIVEYVVPEGRQGLPNLVSAKQILESWRSKRVIDPQKVEEALAFLNSRSNTLTEVEFSSTQDVPLSKNDVFKRIEEDRERHKRLRERRWVQPVTHNTGNYRSLPLACFFPLASNTDGESDLPLDVEFENEWETTSDWNEDDDEAAAEEVELCFPPIPEKQTQSQGQSLSWG